MRVQSWLAVIAFTDVLIMVACRHADALNCLMFEWLEQHKAADFPSELCFEFVTLIKHILDNEDEEDELARDMHTLFGFLSASHPQTVSNRMSVSCELHVCFFFLMLSAARDKQ